MLGSTAISIARSTAVSDGEWYRVFIEEYMGDNIPYANNVNFSYKLETWDGVQTVGILTLPVLNKMR